jgi:hypothetical protein
MATCSPATGDPWQVPHPTPITPESRRCRVQAAWSVRPAPPGSRADRARERRSHGEGGVYQRASDGKWVAALDLGWANGRRKRKVLYGTTRRQALDKLNTARHELECGTLATGPAQTVADYLTGWLADIKTGVRPRAYESYDLNVRRLVPHLGRLRLSSLRPQHI